MASWFTSRASRPMGLLLNYTYVQNFGLNIKMSFHVLAILLYSLSLKMYFGQGIEDVL